MNGYQKLLKLFSIFAIVLGALVLSGGVAVALAVFSVTSNPESLASIEESLASEGMEDVNAQDLVDTVGQSGSIILLIGAFVLIIGILGVIGANNPRKSMPVYIFSIIGLVAACVTMVSGILSMIYGAPLTSPWAAVTSVLSVALMALFFWLSRKVKQIAYV